MGNQIAKAIAWVLLGLASIMLGAVLSASAAAFGLTSFVGDNRGEWYLVVAPLSFVIVLAIGVPVICYLRKTASTQRLLGFSAVVSLAAFCFYTWRFVAFAA